MENKNLGVKIFENEKDIISDAEIIIQLALPDDEKISWVKENQTLIGVLDPYNNK